MVQGGKIKRGRLRNRLVTDGKLSQSVLDQIAAGGGGGSSGPAYIFIVYIDAAQAPNTPTGGAYDADTGVLTPPNGWVADRPTNIASTLYISYGVVSGDNPITWTQPIKEVSPAGFDLSTILIRFIFTQDSGKPSLPIAAVYEEGAAEGGFGTTLGSRWSIDRPTVVEVGNEVYESLGLVDTNTGTIQWSNPVVSADQAGFVPSVPNIEDNKDL